VEEIRKPGPHTNLMQDERGKKLGFMGFEEEVRVYGENRDKLIQSLKNWEKIRFGLYIQKNHMPTLIIHTQEI